MQAQTFTTDGAHQPLHQGLTQYLRVRCALHTYSQALCIGRRSSTIAPLQLRSYPISLHPMRIAYYYLQVSCIGRCSPTIAPLQLTSYPISLHPMRIAYYYLQALCIGRCSSTIAQLQLRSYPISASDAYCILLFASLVHRAVLPNHSTIATEELLIIFASDVYCILLFVRLVCRACLQYSSKFGCWVGNSALPTHSCNEESQIFSAPL